jgi:hypothetical protein
MGDIMALKLSFVVLSIALLLGFQNCNRFTSLNSLTEQSSVVLSKDNYDLGAQIPKSLDAISSLNSNEFGLMGDCQTDDTAALQSFFKKGGILKKPNGSCYLTTDTIFIPSNVQVQGEGPETLIKLKVPMNSAARPVLDFSGSGTRTTTNIHISKLAIDGGGDRMTQLPIKYNGNIGYGSAIIVQSSQSSVTDVKVMNAWDTGIAFYQLGCLDGGPGQQCNTFPKNVTALRITCQNNGIGEGSKFLGSCVGALTSQNTLIADSVDYGSAVGFHHDYGGAAQATFKNLKTYNNHLVGYWIGSAQGYFENIEAYDTLDDHKLNNPLSGNGLVLDRFASGRGDIGKIPNVGIIKNFKSVGARKSGMVVAASGWKIENAEIISANQSNQNHSAILGLGSSQQIAGLSIGVSNTDIINAKVSSLSSYPHQVGFGYQEEIHEGSCISMNFIGGSLKGNRGQFSPEVGHQQCTNQTVNVVEIENLIKKIFLEILKREPQKAGLDYYVQMYMSGKSMVDIREEIGLSTESQCIKSGGTFNIDLLRCVCPEASILVGKSCQIVAMNYEDIVRKAFQDILKRDPLQAGLDYYVSLLKSGKTEQFVRNEISASAEAQCVKLGQKYLNGQCLP